FGEAVSGISSLITNSVALTVRVPSWSAVKLAVAPFLLEVVLGLSYVSPRFGEAPALSRGKLLSRLVSLFHPECDEPSCHLQSMMWGSGPASVCEHAMLDEVTHRRSADLLGGTTLAYHRHV